LKDLSITSLTGRIHRKVRFGKREKDCEFSLKTDRGLFSIRASGPELLTVCKALKAGNQVYVLSRPGGFFYRQCRREHVYFEAITILPVEDTPDYEALLKVVILEAVQRWCFEDKN
jgi:hypothetical protein